MQPPRERRPDPELIAARHRQRLGFGLFGLGAFAVVADVLSKSYEAPQWVGPLLLILAGGVWGSGARDAIQSLARRAAPPAPKDDPDA